MKIGIRLALVLALAVLGACGQCRDRLADGKHFACNNACQIRDDNNQNRHDKGECYCSTSCPCWAVQAKEEPPKK
jgi:hypothetical protein